MMHMFRYGYNGWGMTGWVMMAIQALVMIGVVIWIAKTLTRNSSSNNRALLILDEKFARGEMTEEEYIQKRNILKER